jgi:TatD DNase family protein
MINLHPFINLHTHRKAQLSQEHIVRNGYLLPIDVLNNLPYSVSSGIHPWLISNNHFEQLNHLEELIYQVTNVCALGECGLDRVKGPPMEIQLDAFKVQIQLANHYKKPLILHLVKTYSDFLAVSNKIMVPCIVHGFKGNQTEANQLISKGAKLSFGPRLLIDLQLQEIFKNIPLELLYLETDTKPISIATVYQKAAELKNLPVDALRETISNNFARDFNC